MELFLQTETWIALLTLTFLEIVLGVDNIIFISIVSNKLPENQQEKARKIGLSLALVFRIILLLGISYIVQFTQPIISIVGFKLSGRDLILFFGGLFLLFKSTMEIHHKIEGTPEEIKANSTSSLKGVILQIVFLDIIFSFDSILTAVGLVKEVSIMIIAVVISILIMMAFALSFLMLIGFMLLVEGLHFEVPKGYIYFAVFFSLAVEIINMRVRKKTNGNPVELKPRIKQTDD